MRRAGIVVAAALGALQLMPRPARAQAEPAEQALFSEIAKKVAPKLGMAGAFRVEAQALGAGEGLHATTKLTLDDGSRREAVVVKLFPRGMIFKKGMLGFVPIPARHIARSITPAAQFKADVEMTAAFKAAGFKTLEILLESPRRKILVTRFLEGAVGMDTVAEQASRGDARSLDLVELLGRRLAQVHRAGLAVGDMATGNAMVLNGEIYFIDVDHGSWNGNKALDVAEFLYTAGRTAPSIALARAFLKGYLENGGSITDVMKARHLNYMMAPGFQTRLATLKTVHRQMRTAADDLARQLGKKPSFD